MKTPPNPQSKRSIRKAAKSLLKRMSDHDIEVLLRLAEIPTDQGNNRVKLFDRLDVRTGPQMSREEYIQFYGTDEDF